MTTPAQPPHAQRLPIISMRSVRLAPTPTRLALLRPDQFSPLHRPPDHPLRSPRRPHLRPPRRVQPALLRYVRIPLTHLFSMRPPIPPRSPQLTSWIAAVRRVCTLALIRVVAAKAASPIQPLATRQHHRYRKLLLWTTPATLAATAHLCSLALFTPVYAQANPHQTEETANCLAQGPRRGGGYCPTPTPSPSSLPVPSATPSPQPAPAPAPSPTPTPEPVVPPPGLPLSPQAGYTRPLNDDWLELALPTGRWAIHGCTNSWLNVWLDLDENTAPYLSVPGGVCGIDAWQWLSDTPCAMTQDVCDVQADPSYWYMLSLTPEPTLEPTPQPAPTAPPVAVPAPPVVAPPQPQIRTVIQTVVVEVTQTPQLADTATPSPPPTSTLRPSTTTTPTTRPTLTSTPRATLVPPPTQTALPTPTPEPATSFFKGKVPEWLDGPLGLFAIIGTLIGGVVAVPMVMHRF